MTANKAMLAYHRYELQEIAGDIPLMYEASTAGGIPIIGCATERFEREPYRINHGDYERDIKFYLNKDDSRGCGV